MRPPRPDRSRRRTIRAAWRNEVDTARSARRNGHPDVEWMHLERAHIVSQPLALAHITTHAFMLAHGLRRRDRREIGGQVFRLLVAGPGSITRRYPIGNTGGAAVSPYAPMPIPADLKAVLGTGLPDTGDNP